jgi:hypothetical protein
MGGRGKALRSVERTHGAERGWTAGPVFFGLMPLKPETKEKAALVGAA